MQDHSSESIQEIRTLVSRLPLRGILFSSYNDTGFVKPRGKLAIIAVQYIQKHDDEKFRSETRNFFDKQSENIFLSLCAQGYHELPGVTSTEPSRSAEEWKETTYMSKVKHSWFLERHVEMQRGSCLELSEEARDCLQNISSKMSSVQDTYGGDIQDDIFNFFSEFGSHVSLGPFAVGGRSVEKVFSSDCQDLDGEYLWQHLEDKFKDMKPQEVDIRSAGGDAHFITIAGEGGEDRFVEISRQVHLFGGDENPSDFEQWKESLATSNLLISGAASLENLQPVWDIVAENVEVFGEMCESLSSLLKDTWSRKYEGSDPNYEHTLKAQEVAEESKTGSDVESDDYKTASDDEIKKERNTLQILDKLHLSREIHSLSEATLLRKDVQESGNTNDVLWKFVRSLFSLDYRGRKCIKTQSTDSTLEGSDSDTSKSDFSGDEGDGRIGLQSYNTVISAMDVTFAILHCCDPFLRQELLWKMVECRLAVPVLLPGIVNKGKLEFQLWGLRKIYKTWKSKVGCETPLERSVVSHPIPIVSFLRVDDITFSKSKLLNKIMGKLQGNNDHSFFVDTEEEPPCATHSKGSLEVAWSLPEGTCDENDVKALRDAITFFNLRGDAMNFPVQEEFACKASDVVVVLVERIKYTKRKSHILNVLADMSKHLVCIISNDQNRAGTIKRQGNITLVRSRSHLTDIGACICQELNKILWPQERSETFSECPKFRSLESLTKLCDDLRIKVDEKSKHCIEGKALAHNIKEEISQSPETYKVTHLPLQGKLWKVWSNYDKMWSKGYGHQRFKSIEHYHDYLKQEMSNIRAQQRRTQPADDIAIFVEALKLPDDTSKYFLEWLNFFLNNFSQDKLGPLRKELRNIQNKSRDINAKKSKLKDNAEMSRDDETQLSSLNDEDRNLLEQAQEITNQIDSWSLGVEHYIRELGQLFEAYEELKGEVDTDVDQKINAGALPDIAAQLLIDGNPLEILDGDVGRVPIKWVQAVFASVKEKLGNAMVCAISVLGIQSSGKSTLLNSMFGVRFAVSAGRCTRGVFIQLLKVHEDLSKETGCDYVIVIDTEGLKAPERSVRDDFRHDNELATFALCLADLTVVNIAGQTVGKDMTDVLQIAAHAFIRMKEVRIKSSCRIIQQFVSDLAAVDKNETCTQAILSSLDEAIAAAAKEEGYGNLYTRFSDVFNLKRDEDVQYIPSLWQGSMAPPNHRYSEMIMQLRKVIIDDLKHCSRTFQQFAERTAKVWDAVKEENFIFSFQNCVIALRYKTFQHVYGKWIGEMRQTVMEWESNAGQRLKNVPQNQLDDTKVKMRREIDVVVRDESEKIQDLILSYLKDNITDDDDQLHKFEEEFLQDLDLTQRNFIQDARETLERTADSIAQLKDITVLLPKCKNQLREKARTQAVELRKEHSHAASIDKAISKEEIDNKFEELWEEWIFDICRRYPTKPISEEDVRKEFDLYLIRQQDKKDLSNVVKRKLGIWKGKFLKGATKIVYGKQEEIVQMIITHSIHLLHVDIEKDLAFDPGIIQKLIDTTIDQLNSKYKGNPLTQEDKEKAIIEVCEQAVPVILKARHDYNLKYSLKELLSKEKENLKMDFQALCSDSFLDQRALESLTTVLRERVEELLHNYLGPAIYKAVREVCSYFSSKFAMFGYVLEDMAQKEEFSSYYKFIFELEKFLEEWSLHKIAEVCVQEKNDGKSFVQDMAERKVTELRQQLLDCVNSTIEKTIPLANSDNDDKTNTGSNDQTLLSWIQYFCDELQTNVPILNLPDEDVRNLLWFDVKDITFFGIQVKDYIEKQMMQDIIEDLQLPGVDHTAEAEVMLRRLPTKPHEEIKKHVSGCTEQCPICHVPCDNMTKRHEKHRSELHYPEGVVGCAVARDERLACTICTSSVATNELYWDGQRHRKYCEYQKDYPSWVIQPVQNDSPLKYWKWVMNYFNEDFAQLYGRREALLPEGWVSITKKQAIEDLREAYATKQISES